MKLSELHDSSLIQLTLDWRSGLLSCRLNTGEGPVILEADRLKKLTCPRKHPWGASVSINEVKAYDIDGGLCIQMKIQSGDKIEIVCEGFNLQHIID